MYTIKQHTFNPNILRQYDIRGVYGTELTEADAYAIGFCFAQIVSKSCTQTTIAIGRDGRISSPTLERSLIEGIHDAGLNCISIGLVPTPALYFAIKHLQLTSGIMITGSHNEGDFNGFKLVLNNQPFYGKSIQELQQMAKDMTLSSLKGTVTYIDILPHYIHRLLQDCTLYKSMKVIWDAGNGASGVILKKLVEHLPGEHIILFDEVDGTFPHHHPDPTIPENLTHLIETVKKEQADLGIAFDGDADRLGLVDNEGNILFGDQQMILFSREVLRSQPNANIIFDVKCSDLLEEDIKAHGGNPIRWSTGHSMIKAKMSETKALLAGEMSGHIFFADKYYGFDDALYSAIRLLNIVGKMKNPFSSFFHSLPIMYQTPEIRIPCTLEQKNKAIQHVTDDLKKLDSQNVSFLDGIRVSTSNGWWLMRASNTQNVISCRCESKSAEGLMHLKNIIRHYLMQVGIESPSDLL